MPSIREQILVALLTRLETVPDATVKREAPLPDLVVRSGGVHRRASLPYRRSGSRRGADHRPEG
ncbi:hypothetical protein MTBSS4_520006 [Magnetospirillum sp. SS-4]|nr:hypothetical protein MTBSS4_520006 [Magnetospirillum sp. SS-4]